MNLLKYILILTLTVFITACTSNTIYKKPKDLIAKDQMVDLLVDMYLANAAKNVKTKKSERKINYMPLVYEKYGIDSTRFQKSNIYYMSLIDEHEAIYKKVDARLRKMLDTIEASIKTIDSLKKVERKSKKKLPNKNKFNKEKILKTIAEEQK